MKKFFREFISPHYYGYFGFFLIVISFFYWTLQPFTNHLLIYANLAFYIGNILLFDAISYNFAGFSLFHSTNSFLKFIMHALLLGGLFGLVIEFYYHWLGKLWYYPYWSFSFYLLIFVPGFTVYCLYMVETYLGVKAVLQHFFHHKRKKESFVGMKKIFLVSGLLGSLGIGALSVYMFMATTIQGFLNGLFLLKTPLLPQVPLSITWILAIFIWLFFEYVEYERHETSLLFEIIHGNYIPLVAVLFSSLFSAILYESFNVPGGLWRYANFPFENIRVWQVPLFVILTWPFQYFPLFSLYRVLFKKETVQIWQ